MNALALLPEKSILAGGSFTAINSAPGTNLAKLTLSGVADPMFLLPTNLNNAVAVGGDFVNVKGSPGRRSRG